MFPEINSCFCLVLEHEALLIQLTQGIAQQQSNVFQEVLKTLPEDRSSKLQACLTLTNGSWKLKEM